MKNRLKLVLRLMLILVVLSSVQSIWIGLTNRPRYLRVFPGAMGGLYYLTLLTSFGAGANCVAIWQTRRWAVWLNILIGAWSIALIGIVGGPRANQWVVLAASATTTVLPFLVWERAARKVS